MNKKSILALMLVLCLSASGVYAKEYMSVDEMVNKLKKELNLSDDQVTQVRPVVQDFHDAKEKAEGTKMEKLKGILTPEQNAKLVDMKAKHDK